MAVGGQVGRAGRLEGRAALRASVDNVPVHGGAHAGADRAARRVRSWSFAVPVIGACGGLLFVASAVSADGTDLRSAGTSLSTLVDDRADEVAGLRRDVRALQAEVDQLSAGVGDRDLQEVRDAVDRVSGPAGLTPVSGPGLVVTLEDSPLEEPPEPLDANALVVHQQDIQAFVNALWAGGAGGIALQGQRLVSTTGIKCVGNTVVLHGVPYSPPYRIEAVGDPTALTVALEDSREVGYYRDYVDEVDLGLDVQAADALELPEYAGPPTLEYAEPLTG